MPIQEPEISEIYEAAGPSEKVDSRAEMVWVTSLALLAFSLASKPAEIEILGLTFHIKNAFYLGFALFLALAYSAVQLWIAWYTNYEIFTLKYGKEWASLWAFVNRRENTRQDTFIDGLSESERILQTWQARRRKERELEKRLRPLRQHAHRAQAALRKAMTSRKAADEAEEAEMAYEKERQSMSAIMASWDRNNHWPPGDGVQIDEIVLALAEQSEDRKDLSRNINRFRTVARVIRCRRWLELIGPWLAAVAATTLFFRGWLGW